MCILKVKRDKNGKPDRAKALIVVLGNFDEHDWGKDEVYAPVIPLSIMRLFILMAVGQRRIPRQADCTNAFCQSSLPQSDCYIVCPPSGCPLSPSGTLWRLRKSLYGLRRAPRYWFKKSRRALLDIGLVQCPNEPCLFHGVLIDGEPPLYVGIYVDDLIYFSGSDAVEHHFESSLSSLLEVDLQGDCAFFLGVSLDYRWDSDGELTCHIHQAAYIDKLIDVMNINTEVVSPSMSPFRSGEVIDSIPRGGSLPHQDTLTSLYRRFTGMLQWLAQCSRPDIATAVNLLARFNSCPSDSHLRAARYVGRYLKATPHHGLLFSSKGNSPLDAFVHFPLDPAIPTGFADANWGPQEASITKPGSTPPTITIDDTKSICGHIVFLFGGPLLWKSHRENRNSRAVQEAEIKAADECCKQVQHLRHVLNDLGLLPPLPTLIYSDNQGCVKWCHSQSNKSLRWLDLRANAVREEVQLGEIKIDHISGSFNVADIFTKQFKSPSIFRGLRDSFMWSPCLKGGCQYFPSQ